MLRYYLVKFHQNSKIIIKPLLTRQSPFAILRTQPTSHIAPTPPFFSSPSMFSAEVIAKNIETIPLIAVTVGGIVGAALWTIRQALTRDDVRYCPKNGTMACEYVEMRKRKKPPIRKFRVYNQKYVTPPELIEAIREPTEEEMAELEEKRAQEEKKQKKKQKTVQCFILSKP